MDDISNGKFRYVSIPASHAGRDSISKQAISNADMFQSPRPTRDATFQNPGARRFIQMFQSPRPTRDATSSGNTYRKYVNCFNPRVPRGTRPDGFDTLICRSNVSIPASHAGRDSPRRSQKRVRACFNPRVPRGTRLMYLVGQTVDWNVSIPASHAGRDLFFHLVIISCKMFQSPRPTRDATIFLMLFVCC